MSMYMKRTGEFFYPKYDDEEQDNRTVQSFKDSTDINKIVNKAAKTGALSHLDKYGGQYGEFIDFDFGEAMDNINRANAIFDELPAEVRKDFGNNAGNFFSFANDPANVDRLTELLPAIAEPGSYFPTPNRGPAGGDITPNPKPTGGGVQPTATNNTEGTSDTPTE